MAVSPTEKAQFSCESSREGLVWQPVWQARLGLATSVVGKVWFGCQSNGKGLVCLLVQQPRLGFASPAAKVWFGRRLKNYLFRIIQH